MLHNVKLNKATNEDKSQVHVTYATMEDKECFSQLKDVLATRYLKPINEIANVERIFSFQKP